MNERQQLRYEILSAMIVAYGSTEPSHVVLSATKEAEAYILGAPTAAEMFQAVEAKTGEALKNAMYGDGKAEPAKEDANAADDCDCAGCQVRRLLLKKFPGLTVIRPGLYPL